MPGREDYQRRRVRQGRWSTGAGGRS
jgi:hypothetical protein